MKRDRFEAALANIPETGGGCHLAMMGAANCGVFAGLTDDEIFGGIKSAITGNRKVPNGEISATIAKARRDNGSVAENQPKEKRTYKPRYRHSPVKPLFNGAAEIARMKRKAVDLWGEFSFAELWELSPVRLNDEQKYDPYLLFDVLYKQDDYLFIGSQYDKQVKTVAEWIRDDELLSNPFIIPNPLTGDQHKTDSGKLSYRANSCVKDFKYAVVEFDEMTFDDQLAFWLTTTLPVCTIIHSGGKSLHGWVKAEVSTADEWDKEIKEKLFDYLTACGADKACKNPARLSRLPGHYRKEKEHYQQLLYLSPNGEPPSCRT